MKPEKLPERRLRWAYLRALRGLDWWPDQPPSYIQAERLGNELTRRGLHRTKKMLQEVAGT